MSVSRRAARPSDGLRPVEPPDLNVEALRGGAVAVRDGARIEERLVTELESVDAARGITVVGSLLQAVRLTGSRIEGAAITDCVFEHCELSGASWGEAELRRVRFEGCRMSGFVAPALMAKDVSFMGCKLDGAWLRMASLTRVEFVNTELREADFYSTRLRHCRFTDSTLDDCEFSGVRFERTSFFGSTVKGIRGAESLRNIVIRPDQLLDFAVPILGALHVELEDELET